MDRRRVLVRMFRGLIAFMLACGLVVLPAVPVAAIVLGEALADDRPTLTGVAPRAPFATVYPDKTRVTFDLPASPGSVVATLASDGALVVDHTGVDLEQAFTLQVGSPEIDSVVGTRLGGDPARVRIVLDLARYQRFRVMSLAPSPGEDLHRVVVDVYKRSDGPPGDGPPLICIDPGHGGRDPGAIGVSGSYEKDLNLSLSLLLAQNLRAGGLRVTMTRSTDTYVDLFEQIRF